VASFPPPGIAPFDTAHKIVVVFNRCFALPEYRHQFVLAVAYRENSWQAAFFCYHFISHYFHGFLLCKWLVIQVCICLKARLYVFCCLSLGLRKSATPLSSTP
jgi:hypothetical protein